MEDALSLLLLPFAASVAFVLIHAYFGVHVLRRNIVFADLALAQLSAMVRNFVGYELDWDLQLVVDRAEVPSAALGGGARLGWSSWLHSTLRARDADDVVLTQMN